MDTDESNIKARLEDAKYSISAGKKTVKTWN